MIPNTTDLLKRLILTASALIWLAATTGSTADPPSPTPRRGSLAAYAGKVTLNRSALENSDGRLILTNDSVASLAVDGSITLGTVKEADRKKATPGVRDAERSRWQAAHRQQRHVIAGLERRRSRLEFEIDQIEDLDLSTKTMARLEQSEAKLRLLNGEISAERAELARIVRDARRRGAEPGWFR